MNSYHWIKRVAVTIGLLAVMFFLSPSANIIASLEDGCSALPSHTALTEVLHSVVSTGDNAGFGLHMWATLVNRDGEVCAVTFSGENRGDQWPGSRVISAQKANTANSFSLPSLALSTANLYSAVQPGGSLYGLQHSNPVDPAVAYGGSAMLYGQPNDPMTGHKIGGVNVFGGGLALYDETGELLGAIGVSGDSSCTDHIIAWRVRDHLGLDYVPSGVSTTGDDNIIYDVNDGFGHPECGLGEVEISEMLSSSIGDGIEEPETMDDSAEDMPAEDMPTEEAPAEDDIEESDMAESNPPSEPTEDAGNSVFPPSPTGSRVAIANRGTNTVSLVDVDSEEVLQIVLDKLSEPMYVQNPLNSDELWIGDRGRSRVIVYDALRLRQIADIPAGKGVFHMWSHPGLGQMWVVNDIDKSLSVMSLADKKGVATVPIPPDLAENYKPHDITMTPTHVIVSLLGDEPTDNGWLVKYSGKTYKEEARLEVPADPHMMHWGLPGSQLYVAVQAGKVLQIDPEKMHITGELDIPGAHGIWANEAETYLYVTDITSADGKGSIYTIDIPTFEIIADSPVDAPLPNPHNVMASIDNNKLFITHSKNSEWMSVFDLDENGLPTNARIIETGTTPFGIMLVRDPQISEN